MEEEKKLYPMRLVPQDSPETGARYHLADLRLSEDRFCIEKGLTGLFRHSPFGESAGRVVDRKLAGNENQTAVGDRLAVRSYRRRSVDCINLLHIN